MGFSNVKCTKTHATTHSLSLYPYGYLLSTASGSYNSLSMELSPTPCQPHRWTLKAGDLYGFCTGLVLSASDLKWARCQLFFVAIIHCSWSNVKWIRAASTIGVCLFQSRVDFNSRVQLYDWYILRMFVIPRERVPPSRVTVEWETWVLGQRIEKPRQLLVCSQMDHLKRSNLQPYTYSAKPLHYLQIVTYVDRGEKIYYSVISINYHIRHSSFPHLLCAFRLFRLQGLILLWGLLSLSVTSEVGNDISVSKRLKDEIVFLVLASFSNVPHKVLLLLQVLSTLRLSVVAYLLLPGVVIVGWDFLLPKGSLVAQVKHVFVSVLSNQNFQFDENEL